jgi:hypothetical protein
MEVYKSFCSPSKISQIGLHEHKLLRIKFVDEYEARILSAVDYTDAHTLSFCMCVTYWGSDSALDSTNVYSTTKICYPITH